MPVNEVSVFRAIAGELAKRGVPFLDTRMIESLCEGRTRASRSTIVIGQAEPEAPVLSI